MAGGPGVKSQQKSICQGPCMTAKGKSRMKTRDLLPDGCGSGQAHKPTRDEPGNISSCQTIRAMLSVWPRA